MVRWGRIEDADELRRLARRCWDEELPGLNWMPLDIDLMQNLVLTDTSVVTIVSERENRLDGVLIGQLTRSTHSDTRIANSLWLYVEPESRWLAPKRLIQFFENWAVLNEAELVQISTSGSERVERNLRFFQHLDYDFSGVVMTKRLQP